MDPGELDKRVYLVGHYYAGGRDAAGAPQKAGEYHTGIWAKVTYPGGREFLANNGEATSRRAVFRIWPRPDVDVGSTIHFKGVDWDIQDIRPFDDVMELHAVAPALKAAA